MNTVVFMVVIRWDFEGRAFQPMDEIALEARSLVCINPIPGG